MKIEKLLKFLNEMLEIIVEERELPKDWDKRNFYSQIETLTGDFIKNFDLPEGLSFRRIGLTVVCSDPKAWEDSYLFELRMETEKKKRFLGLKTETKLKSIYYELVEGVEGETKVEDWMKTKRINQLTQHIESQEKEVLDLQEEIKPILQEIEALELEIKSCEEELQELNK